MQSNLREDSETQEEVIGRIRLVDVGTPDPPERLQHLHHSWIIQLNICPFLSSPIIPTIPKWPMHSAAKRAKYPIHG